MNPELTLLFIPFGAVLAILLRYLFRHLPNAWQDLSEHYPAPPHFSGRTFKFRRVKFNGEALTIKHMHVGVNQEGVLFRPMVLMSRPIFVPWADVRSTVSKSLSLHPIELRFQKDLSNSLELSRDLARKLETFSCGSWKVST